MKGLTKRQREVMDFIQDYIRANQYSPSYRDIMQKFGFSSLGSVHKHVHVLKRKGVLVNEEHTSRSLAPVIHKEEPKTILHPIQNPSTAEIKLPFIGYIVAGEPIQTFPQVQTIAVPHFLVANPEKTYALRAKGELLAEELIADGDLVIVEARHEAHPGETIIALIHNRNTRIKRYYPEEKFVRLESLVPRQHSLDIPYEHLIIQGIVTGLMRIF